MAAPVGFIPDAPPGFVSDQPAVAPQQPESRESLVAKALRFPFRLAGQLDVASGIKTPEQAESRAKMYTNIIPPVAVGAATGGASLPLQALTQAATTAAMQQGGLEEKSLPGVIASGALPFGMAGLGRLARGLGRTVTRLIPSRFLGAQQAAQEGAEQVATRLEPTGNVGALFKGYRAQAAEPIPATQLRAMIDDLDITLPKAPTSAGLKTARELMDSAKESIKGDTIGLGDLMRLRLDTGRSLTKAPEVAALHKAILGDLEQAGGAGGAGAQLAQQALIAARQEHGAAILRGLVADASKGRSALTGEQPLLSISQLSRGVEKNRDKLTKALGPQGMAQIEEFMVKNRALPPVHAYTAWNGLVSGLGFMGGALPGLAGWELVKNAYAVGRNPAELNRFMIMLGEGTRAGIAGTAEQAVKSRK